MKLKSDYILKNLGDNWIAVSVNDDTEDGDAFVSMNSSGAFVWELLENEISYDEIIIKMTEKYDIDADVAKSDLNMFLNNIRKAGMLLE